jgi:Rad3-related DNA helicase
VDEAHSVGDWALNYVSCTVDNNGKNIPVYKTFKMYVEWLNGIAGELIEKLKAANEQMKSADESGELVLGLKERRDSIAMILSKVMNVINDYHDNAEDWVWEIFDKGTRKERIQFKPITAGRFLDKVIWWRGEKILTMSGTLFPELFIEESGLIDSVCEYNEIPSTFPPENRPIYYYPCGKMTMSQREYTIPVLAEHVDTIMNRNLDKKGFVHCGSYKIAEAIHDSIVDDNSVSDVWLQDRSRIDDHLEEWMESKEPSLFLSVNRTEGVDLKAELCGYQIVVKVQFPYLGDAQVKARLNMKKYRCPDCGKITRTVEELVDCTCGGNLILDMDVYTFTCDACGKKLISGWAKHKEILDKGTCVCGGNMNMSVTTIDGQYWYNANAVIDLVQSYGRAIRSKTDKAEYWILDSSFMGLYKRMYTLFPKMFKECVQVVK